MQVYWRQQSGDLTTVAQEAQRAEALGFDGFSSHEDSHDGFLPLVVATKATQRIKLETRAAIAFPRSPTAVAYISWDIQDYSQGRFKLGLATQSKAHVEQRLATQFSPVNPRIREYIQALFSIWDCWHNGTDLNFQGEYYNVTFMPQAFRPGPFRYGRPPLYLGAANPRNIRLAGELADGLLIQTFNSRKYIEEIAIANLEEGARRSARSRKDLKINSGGTIATGGNKEELKRVKEQARRNVAFYASYSNAYRQVFRVHGWGDKHEYLRQLFQERPLEEIAKEITDDMLEAFAVIGEYDEIGTKTKERYGGLVDEVCFTFLTPPLARKDEDELLNRFVRDLKS